MEAPQPNNPEGERFGRYLLLERIGHGGMAEVFRAVAHGVEGFQRVFVVKRILKEKSASPAFINMFVAEARLSALLNHPNIVQIYDFGQVDGSYFLSMEYLRGKNLQAVMRQLRAADKKMDPGAAAYIAQQVASGLHYAHSLTHAGGQPLAIVHRDVSPSNIVLLRAGGVKLLDFGIAKVGSVQPDAPEDTRPGMIKGKLSYLAPEQIRGAALDGRADIFSLGVVLWELLTGRRLFYAKDDTETLKNVVERPVLPPSLIRPDSPTNLDYVVLRALERDPQRRYGSAREMVEELEAFLTELRFSPGSVPRLLDELFGEDTGIFDAQIPDVTSGSINTLSTSESSILNRSLTVPPMAVDRQASGGRRVQGGRRRQWLFAGILLTVLAGLGVIVTRQMTSSPDVVSAVSVSPSPNATPVSDDVVEQPAEAGNAGAAVEIETAPKVEPTSFAVAAPPEKTTVNVRFETIPRGADVLGADGKLLGRTPTTFSLQRSKVPVAIVVRKKGFVEAHHEIVPDRDLSALLTLMINRGGKGRLPPSWRSRLELISAENDAADLASQGDGNGVGEDPGALRPSPARDPVEPAVHMVEPDPVIRDLQPPPEQTEPTNGAAADPE